MNPWDDYKMAEGRKFYRCICKLCEIEFYHPNPYKVLCTDAEKHKLIRRQQREHARWAKVGGREPYRDQSGTSFDDIVKLYEGA